MIKVMTGRSHNVYDLEFDRTGGSITYIMKRKLLGLIFLYVLGVAILQKAGFSVLGGGSFSQSPLPETFSGEITGEVAGYAQTASGYQLRISTIYIFYDDVRIQEKIGIQCYFAEQSGFHIGDIVSLEGTFSVPEVPTNPGQFNTYIYNKSRGIDFTAYEPVAMLVCGFSARRDISLPYRGLCLWRQALLSWKYDLAEVFRTLMCEEDAGIFCAMLLGDKRSLSPELSRLYQANGISHVLAISGLHVGLVGGMFYGLLRFFGVSYLFSGLVGIFVTFSYGYMTGASDASMRAAAMLAVGMVGAMLGRTSDLLTAMGIGAAILISCSAWKLYDPGFLLSFGAVLGIGYGYPSLEKGLALRHKWSKALCMSAAIQAFTLPVLLHFYGTVAPYSILLNLAVIPIMTPVLALGMAGVLSGCAGTLSGYTGFIWLAERLLSLAGVFVHGISWMCTKVSALPFASVILGSMETWQVVIYYAALALLCVLLRYMAGKKQHKWRLAVILLLFFMTVQCVHRRPRDMLTLLDVGQGDGILLQTGTGLHILVDCGSTSEKDVGQYVLEPALKYYGIRRLDYVIVTHSDADHVNGITYLLEQSDASGTAVGTLLLPRCCGRMEGYVGLSELAMRNGVAVGYLEPGMELKSGTFTMTCLSPKADAALTDINDLSVVLAVSYDQTRLLLTGDISTEAEEQLYAYEGFLANMDILKVAHHGSRYSTSEAFLRLTSPKLALISCGENNVYGHPADETLDRIYESGADVCRTDKEGAIEVSIDGSSIKIRKWRVKRE